MYIYVKNFGIDKCKIIEDYGAQVKVDITKWSRKQVVFRKNIYMSKEEAQIKEYNKIAKDLKKKISDLQKNLQYYKDIFEIDKLKSNYPEMFLI